METPLAPCTTLKNRLPRLVMVLANAVALACSTARAGESDSQYCVTDMSDRAVCLDTRSPNIISLSPGSTELLFAAGAGERVIAVDQHSDFPDAVKQLLNCWSQRQNLQAVQRQQLFSVTGDLIARPTPGILDGAEMIRHQLQAVRSKASHAEPMAAQTPLHQQSLL